jgi:hypothetical protein
VKNPVELGEDCDVLVHRPSLGGTPTENCPCSASRFWWGPEEDDPRTKPPVLKEPTPESQALVAVRRSWWEEHQRRVDELSSVMDQVMEPFALHGPSLPPFLARPNHEPNELGWAAPHVRFLCPRGHLVDDVRADKFYDDDDVLGFTKRWNLRSALKWNEAQYRDGRGLHAAAPWHEVNNRQGMTLRNRARCRNVKCRYDGEKTLEELLKLYAAAVAAGVREVQFRD